MTDSPARPAPLADPHLRHDATPGRRDIVVLGSTGSIGTQAVDLVLRNPDRFRVTALSAAGGGSRALSAVAALAAASWCAASMVRLPLASPQARFVRANHRPCGGGPFPGPAPAPRA